MSIMSPCFAVGTGHLGGETAEQPHVAHRQVGQRHEDADGEHRGVFGGEIALATTGETLDQFGGDGADLVLDLAHPGEVQTLVEHLAVGRVLGRVHAGRHHAVVLTRLLGVAHV